MKTKEAMPARAGARRRTPKLSARLGRNLHSGGTQYWFEISNGGGAAAFDVNFEVIGRDTPFVAGDAESKLPCRVLEPGQTLALAIVVRAAGATRYETRLTWKNPDGSSGLLSSVVSI